MPRREEFDKAEVMQKAMNLFWEKGYHGTAMQELVEVTGLNRSSLYNSFGSKLELYQQTLKHYQKQSGGVFQRALLKAKDPLDAIRLIFEGFLPEMTGERSEMGCFTLNCKMEMGNQEESIKKWLLETQDRNLELFEGLIREGQEQGLINKYKNSEQYAYFVMNAFQGFRLTGILVKDQRILRQIIEDSLSVLR